MRDLALLALTGLLLSACGSAPLIAPDASGSATAAPTDANIQAATATPLGTWETVIDGVIYEGAAGVGQPITGASVTFNVVHSYFPELQAGRPNQTVTDAQGQFSLPVIVHDTDRVQLIITAQGFMPYEESLAGFDLVAGRSLRIGLTREVPTTAGPP